MPCLIPPPMSSASTRRTLVLVGLLLGALLLGCGSRAKRSDGDVDANQPIAECDAFVAAYAHCLSTLGPEGIAQVRAEQTRAGLLAQTEHADAAARTALRKQYAANLSQLKATCR